jgi:ABC-type lipoprotein release transport system permease subunit
MLSGLMSGLVYETPVSDPTTSSGVVILVFIVALLASVVPARLGAGVDPVKALRADS